MAILVHLAAIGTHIPGRQGEIGFRFLAFDSDKNEYATRVCQDIDPHP